MERADSAIVAHGYDGRERHHQSKFQNLKSKMGTDRSRR